MSPTRLALSALILATAAFGLAQQTGSVSVTAVGGYVAAKNTTNGSDGTWTGLAGTASTATMGFSDGSTQLKFNTNGNGVVSSKNFSNTSTSQDGATTTQTNGSGNVTGTGANKNYSVEWTSTTSSDGGSLSAGTGTYDPWIVTYGDIKKAGVYSDVGTESFYYQASLKGGTFDLLPGQTGTYNFNLSIKGFQFVDLTVGSNGKLDLDFNTFDNFDVYLLDKYAYTDTTKKIDARLALGTLLGTKSAGEQAITNYLNDYLEEDGKLDYALSFGVVYKGVQLPTYNPSNNNTTVVDFHTNTVQAVPEPASFAALAIGGLGLLRRRKRA